MFGELLNQPQETRLNWFEVALSNARGLTRTINVPFTPTHVFIYNPTDANLYMTIGADTVPGTGNADLVCLSQSYYMFTPTEMQTWQFGVLLDNPTSDYPCNIIFAAGESQQDRDKLLLDWTFDWSFSLLNLRAGNIYYLLLGEFLPDLYDLLSSDGGFSPFTISVIVASWSIGVGWTINGTGTNPGNTGIFITLPSALNINRVRVTWSVAGQTTSLTSADVSTYNSPGAVAGNPNTNRNQQVVGVDKIDGSYVDTYNFNGSSVVGIGIEINTLFSSSDVITKRITAIEIWHQV